MNNYLEEGLPRGPPRRGNNNKVCSIVIPAQEPQPIDPNAPSLTRLSHDIAMAITDLLRAESPRTLNSFALVSSYYYRLARYAQQRDIIIELSNPGAAKRQVARIERNELLPAIRRIQLDDGDDSWRGSIGQTSKRRQKITRVICQLLPRLTGLTDLESNLAAGVPKEILKVLNNMPSVRLHCALGFQEGLVALQGMSNLRSVDVVRTYTTSEEVCPVTVALKRVLLSCPNIRSLKLNIGLPTNGCMIPRAPREYCGLGFTNGERPPALEQLHLERYPWGRRLAMQGYVSPWAQAGYPNEGMEEDYWADVFDWTRLRRLKVLDMRFAVKLMPYLTAIHEVNFENCFSCEGEREEHIKTFLEQVPGQLESITVPNMASLSLQVLLRHGATLRKLKVHQHEAWNVDWCKVAVTDELLIQIREHCPQVEVLALDIARQGDWPWSILDILASFPCLHTITIYFELGTCNRETPVQPYVTFAAAQHLCSYFYWKNPHIRRLDLVSGSPAPRGYGRPSPLAWWAPANSTTFKCTLSERDDEAAKGVYKVRCPKLEEESRSRSPWSKEQEAEKVAYLGPTPPAQWRPY